MEETILALAREITCPPAQEETLLGLLCTAAEEEWRGRLRPGVTEEDCREAFLCACAFTAAAGLFRCRRGGTEGVSFTVGEVSVRQGETAEEDAAKALRDEACRLMAPWTEAGGDFAFQGVRT